VKKLALFLLSSAVVWWVSCGGGGGGTPSPPPAITISVSPTTATVETGDTAQFTATVRNTTNTAVTWQVNNTTGGDATVGTISTSGLYKAPASVPSPADVTVKAVSQADSTKSATATVTISLRIGVTVTPDSVTLPAGSTQQFTATVEGSSNQAVTWTVNGITGGNTSVGTISTSGLYTAPLSPPPTGVATITAASQANPDLSDSASATIVFSDATLNGQYAFTYIGWTADDIPLVGGMFTADGNGGLTNGIEDLNDLTGVYENLPFTGSYAISPDGRGSATITTAQGTSSFRFVMSSSNEGRFIPFDATTTPGDFLFTPETTGTIEKQDSAAFLDSALDGGYAFTISGLGMNGFLAASGRFTADAAGGITEGVEDYNDGGVVSTNVPFTGSYSVAPTGRGTATLTSSLGTSQYSFYVVSAQKLLFISLDYLPATIGVGEKQQTTSFSNASLSGNYALTSSALSDVGLIFTVGRFAANGSGSISNGLLDINDSGLPSENVAFTATYAVSANGRGTLAVFIGDEISRFALAMISAQKAFFVQTDAIQTSGGRVYAQQGSSFTTSSLAGSWGLRFSGLSMNGFLGLIAQASADGAGNFTGSNDLNVNDFSGLVNLILDAPLDGTYSVSPNGRVSATMNTADGSLELRGYMVSGSKIQFVGVDNFHFVMGPADKQF